MIRELQIWRVFDIDENRAVKMFKTGILSRLRSDFAAIVTQELKADKSAILETLSP